MDFGREAAEIIVGVSFYGLIASLPKVVLGYMGLVDLRITRLEI